MALGEAVSRDNAACHLSRLRGRSDAKRPGGGTPPRRDQAPTPTLPRKRGGSSQFAEHKIAESSPNDRIEFVVS